MKPASTKQLKTELESKSKQELLDLCLMLVKYKKENKELLSYQLFDVYDEHQFIKDIKNEMDESFSLINTDSPFYIKKSLRKILRQLKRYIKYSKKASTEIEVLLYFCQQYQTLPNTNNSKQLTNIYSKQIEIIRKKILSLHEDLQYDYEQELDALEQ
jgi:hypothetical protein